MNTDAVFPWACEWCGEIILLYVRSGEFVFFFLSSEWSGDSAPGGAGRQAGENFGGLTNADSESIP